MEKNKKSTKKIGKIITVLFLVLSIGLPVILNLKSVPISKVEIQGVVYERYFFSDCYEVTDCNQTCLEIVISNEVKGKPVRVIKESAFFMCSSLKKIVLPNTIEVIGMRAFAYCESLETFVIPKSVKKIEGELVEVFRDCEGLMYGEKKNKMQLIFEGTCQEFKQIQRKEPKEPTVGIEENKEIKYAYFYKTVYVYCMGE